MRSISERFDRGKVIYETRTRYSFLRVVDKRRRRYLVFDDPDKPGRQKPEQVYQSVISLDGSGVLRAAYIDYFNLALVFNPELRKVCLIGLGGGALPKQFLEDYPQVAVTTVEIDPAVVETAYRFFQLPRDERHRVVIEDGRRYLECSPESYDLLLLDAFFARSVPRRLFTAEFFQTASVRLTAEGLLAVNFNGAVTGKKSGPFRAVYRTLREVFPEVYLFAVRGDDAEIMQNLILFALKNRQGLSKKEICRRATLLSQSKVRIDRYPELAGHCYTERIDTQGAELLMDCNGPPHAELNLYEIKAIDEKRNHE